MSAKEPKKDSEWIQHVKNYAKEHPYLAELFLYGHLYFIHWAK